MFLMRFYVCCVVIVDFFNAEIITFVRDKNIICIGTGDDVFKTIYVPGYVNKVSSYEQHECVKNETNNEMYIKILPTYHVENKTSTCSTCLINNGWKKRRNTSEIITDYRWENFPVNNSASIPKKKKYSFSVCENSKVEFIDNEVIIKCKNEHLPYTNNCKNWVHYTLYKENNGSYSVISNNGTNESLKNVEKNKSSKMGSPSSPSSCFRKSHKLEFFETNTSSVNNPILIKHSGILYVSVFVYLNENSILNITLKSKEKTNETIMNGTHVPNKWTSNEISINSDNEALLYFTPTTINKAQDGYWAIDELKFYTQKIRIHGINLPDTSVYPHQTCRSLQKTSADTENTISTCGEEKFGTNCTLDCKEIFEDKSFCENLTVYTNIGSKVPPGMISINNTENQYKGEKCKDDEPMVLNDTVISSTTLPLDSDYTITTTTNLGKNETLPSYKNKIIPAKQPKVHSGTSKHKETTHPSMDTKIGEENTKTHLNKKTTTISVTNKDYTNFSIHSVTTELKENTDLMKKVNDSLPVKSEDQKNLSPAPLERKIVDNLISNVKNDMKFNWQQLYSLTNFSLTLIKNKTEYVVNASHYDILTDCNTSWTMNMKLPNNHTFKLNISKMFFTGLSKKPTIEVCVQTNCTLLIPKPDDIEKITNSSDFKISVTNRNGKTWYHNTLSYNEKNNYFYVEISSDMKQAVPLRNKSYIIYLENYRDGGQYPMFEVESDPSITIAFSCLIIVIIIAIVFLGYLIYAYIKQKYPFDLPISGLSIKTKNCLPEETNQLSDHYKTYNVKTVRSKIDLPATESEVQLLIEPVPAAHRENIVAFPIKLDNFESNLMKYLGDDPYNNDLTKQYKRLETKQNKSTNISLQPKNILKNRYRNLTAYDDTRVILKDNDGEDYINANYVDGYENEKAFIATQAPQKTTLTDFWWMIWQDKVNYIIMLTELVESGSEKCEKYWPDLEQKIRFGKVLIEGVSIKNFSDYIHRQFKIQCEEETRILHHFQYITWPDHGVPLYPQSFTPFVKTLLTIPQNNSPIVVHCTAGCGRTGTLILCDIILRMAAKEKTLDFVKVLRKMREQRVNLVNNVNQYVFAHFVVLECLFGIDFSIPINDSFQDEIWKVLRKTTVKPLMEQLDKAMIQFKRRQVTFNSSLTDDDKKKNRFSNILPGPAQIYLSPSSQDLSCYINAVVVDCYRCPKKFIVTQQPLPNTVQDFWRLIKEYEINMVVSLNEIEENNSDCPQFWLYKDETTQLQISSETENKVYNITKVKINDKSVEKTINILKMKNWKKETSYPKNAKDLILIWKETFNSSWKGDSKIVVTCYDGATASGLFVALAYLLEKINYEQTCDVFSAIRTVRQSREEFVQEWGQMEFLYKAAKVYIEDFENYDNF